MNQSSGTYNGSSDYINIVPPQPVFVPPTNFTSHYITNAGININDESLWDNVKVTSSYKAEKCNEVGCKNGKVLLLHSTVDCKKCNGKGTL